MEYFMCSEALPLLILVTLKVDLQTNDTFKEEWMLAVTRYVGTVWHALSCSGHHLVYDGYPILLQHTHTHCVDQHSCILSEINPPILFFLLTGFKRSDLPTYKSFCGQCDEQRAGIHILTDCAFIISHFKIIFGVLQIVRVRMAYDPVCIAHTSAKISRPTVL